LLKGFFIFILLTVSENTFANHILGIVQYIFYRWIPPEAGRRNNA